MRWSSPREIQVLQLTAQGMTYKQMAATLGISFHTVHRHLGLVQERLRVTSKTEAVVKALKKGYIS